MSALVGINRSWWVEKHNRHHANPNHVELDPDVQNPVVAFTEGRLGCQSAVDTPSGAPPGGALLPVGVPGGSRAQAELHP